MTILKELLSLIEAPQVPIELKDVIEFFPENHGKALSKLWGGHNLVWHRMKFFDGDKLGPAYTKALKAAEDFINADYDTIVDDTYLTMGKAGKNFSTPIYFSERKNSFNREVYLGYDPVRDKLIIGFDADVNEEHFLTTFMEEFADLTGEEFDHELPAHKKVLDSSLKEYKQNGYDKWGLTIEVSDHDGSFSAEEGLDPMPGGFYKGAFKMLKRQNTHIVDLRLD
jgi:hypothetical protein